MKRTTVFRQVLFWWTCLFMATTALAAEKMDQGVEDVLGQKMTGDYPQMVERRLIRALVPYSKTFYFLDGPDQKGATYELLKEFEKVINKQLKTRHLKVHVVVIPTPRDQLIPKLKAGLGDIAAGNLTITKGRLKEVDFSTPLAKNVQEVVVTGAKAGQLKSLEDLAGKEVYTRKSSSYYESLVRLNQRLKKKGKPPVTIVETSEYLEDEDLLDMVAAGLIPIIVMDDHKARFWARIYREITPRYDLVLNSGGKIGWAFRKNSPKLKKVVDGFVKKHKAGTLFGNIIINRYLKNTKHVKNNVQEKELERFRAAVNLFRKYGQKYALDWLLLAALAYQESTIDQSKRSHVGAIGVMQILPSTAKDKNVGIPDIEKIGPNIHAGTKYIRFMVDRYFNDPGMDELNRGLFAFASYNAGPSKISRLRREAEKIGLDPNVWFGNVEVVAAKRIGRETVQYVSNIFKYYTAYLYLFRQSQIKKVVKDAYQ